MRNRYCIPRECQIIKSSFNSILRNDWNRCLNHYSHKLYAQDMDANFLWSREWTPSINEYMNALLMDEVWTRPILVPQTLQSAHRSPSILLQQFKDRCVPLHSMSFRLHLEDGGFRSVCTLGPLIAIGNVRAISAAAHESSCWTMLNQIFPNYREEPYYLLQKMIARDPTHTIVAPGLLELDANQSDARELIELVRQMNDLSSDELAIPRIYENESHEFLSTWRQDDESPEDL